MVFCAGEVAKGVARSGFARTQRLLRFSRRRRFLDCVGLPQLRAHLALYKAQVLR
jgi:hypothetical protein